MEFNGIIWQPILHARYEFAVHLDRNFAIKMVHSQISKDKQGRMNQIANRELKELGVNWANPYSFHDNSCFVSQFYIGDNGKWLSTDWQTIEGLVKKENSQNPVEYHSHNVDTPREAYVLMALFDKWVHYSDVLAKE